MNHRSFFAAPLFKGSLRSHLILIVLVAIIPVLVFSAVMLSIFARQERESVKAGLSETNRALVSALELEFESTLSTLVVLASSATLDSEDLAGFRGVLQRAFPTRPDWKTIKLHDPSGNELIDLLGLPEHQKAGDALSDRGFAELLRTQKPTPVEFHMEPRIGAMVGVRVPVLRGGKIKYVLTAGIEPALFRNILARQKLPEGSLGFVLDRNRTIVAASRPELVGRSVGSLLKGDRFEEAVMESWIEGLNWEDIPFYATFAKSPTSGWSVGLLVPSETAQATLRHSLFAIAGAGALFLLGGLLLAIVIEERISPSLTNLTLAANALGRGEPVSFAGVSPVTEIGALAQDVERAARVLQERAQERDRAEAEIRQINQNLERRVVDQTRELATANQELETNIAELRDEVRERHRIEEALRREHHHLELLQRTELATNEASRIEDILTSAVEHICIYLKWHVGRVVYRAERFPQELSARCVWYFSGDGQRFEDLRSVVEALPYGSTLGARAEASQKVEIIADLGQEHGSDWARTALDTGLLSAVALPVSAGNQVIAVLEFFCDHFVVFDDRLSSIIMRIADQLGRTVERKQAEEALRLSEERFRKAFDEGPIGISLADANCRYFRVNRAFVEMLECSEKDLLGQESFARLHPQDLAKIRELTERLLGGEIDHFRQEARYIDTQGEPVWTHLTATVITSSDGTQKYALQMVENITEQKRIEEKLRESERLAVLGATAAMFAHEIGNPLNSISTTVQLLERDLTRPQPGGKESMLASLHDIRQEITRLGALLHEFRFLSRPHNLALQPASIDRLVRELIEGEAERYAQHGVKVEVAFPADLPLVLADEERIKQALWNVCENAVDAMPNGGTLTLRGYSNGGDVCLDIRDTGMGIPDGLDVFELFTTTKTNGTGLGLAIARQILAAHGGWIRYETKPGEGTVFVVALPQALETSQHERTL
jgi:PAS domain S-box-containing protein